MDQSNLGSILSEFPQVFYKGHWYLGYQDFVTLSGLPKTSLHKILQTIIIEPPTRIYIKNRAYYKIDFCLKYHRWAKGKS